MKILLHTCCGPCAMAPLASLLQLGHEPVCFFYNPNIHPLAEYMRRREGAAQVAAHYGVPLVFADTLTADEQQWRMPERSLLGWATAAAFAGEVCLPMEPVSHEGGAPLKALGKTGLDAAQKILPVAASGDMPQKPVESAVSQEAVALSPLPVLPPAVSLLAWLQAVQGNEHNRCSFCWYTRLERTAAYAHGHGFAAFTSSLFYSRWQNHEKVHKMAQAAAHQHQVPLYYEDYRCLWQEGITLSKQHNIYRQQYCGCLFSEYDRYARSFLKIVASSSDASR